MHRTAILPINFSFHFEIDNLTKICSNKQIPFEIFTKIYRPTAKKKAMALKSDKSLRNLKVKNTYKHNNIYPINGLEFTKYGMHLVVSYCEGFFHVYSTIQNIYKGMGAYSLNLIGNSLLCSTINESATLLATTAVTKDHQIQYVDFVHLQWIRTYGHHTNIITSLSASPREETFLSSSLDNTVSINDLRSTSVIAKLKLSDTYLTAFHPDGTYFAICANQCIAIHDMRRLTDQKAIYLYAYPNNSTYNKLWTGIKYSPNGKYIMTTGTENCIQIFEADTGKPFRIFSKHQNTFNDSLEASFSHDSEYLASGSSDGAVYVWNVQKDQFLQKIKCGDESPTNIVRHVKFEPLSYNLAAASNDFFLLKTSE